MNQKEEFNKVKKLIKEYYDNGDRGLYNTRNIVGDRMVNLFNLKN